MAIVVSSIKTPYKIIFKHEEEKVEFTFRQLSFKTRNIIAGLSTTQKNGRIITDSTLALFLNLKYGIIDIKGLVDPEGEEYKLEFEDETKEALSDDTVDALLMVPFSDNLIFAAREMIEGVPNKITHPLTGATLENVEVISPQEMAVIEKK